MSDHAPGVWHEGQQVVRREILGYAPLGLADASRPWFGKCWQAMPARVVRDDGDVLVVYVEPGAPFTFPRGDWPTPTGKHPWHGRPGWFGHGCLMVQRRDEHHSVWYQWEGPMRRFSGWYINLQTAPRRTGNLLDTLDLEVDFIVRPDGSWVIKDWDELGKRVQEGRFTGDLAAWVRCYAEGIARRLDDGTMSLDTTWCDWRPQWNC